MGSRQSFLDEVARLADLVDDVPKGALAEVPLSDFLLWKLAVAKLLTFLCGRAFSATSVLRLPDKPYAGVAIDLVRNSALGNCLDFDEVSRCVRYQPDVSEETISGAYRLIVARTVFRAT